MTPSNSLYRFDEPENAGLYPLAEIKECPEEETFFAKVAEILGCVLEEVVPLSVHPDWEQYDPMGDLLGSFFPEIAEGRIVPEIVYVERGEIVKRKVLKIVVSIPEGWGEGAGPAREVVVVGSVAGAPCRLWARREDTKERREWRDEEED